jgi:hypothetical protein
MPTDLRSRLVAAATKNGNSLTQEVLDRLDWTLEEDDKIERDLAAQSLCSLLLHVIHSADLIVRPRNWRSDPWAWRVIQEAFLRIMVMLGPAKIGLSGEPPAITPPPNSDPNSRRRNPDPSISASFIAEALMEFYEHSDELPAKGLKGHALKWSLSAAKRNLAIKKEENGQ